ncbi:hypothetical protein AAEX28_05795 [Lentisphaerota bacterium WC36G]|nr:hypothetical protein LJT99_08655 [Lentisphaerae bacterium WC36]
MKKYLQAISVVILILFSANLLAEQTIIKYKDGKEVKVDDMKSFTPVGFDAIIKREEGGSKIFKVYFKDLTEEMQKKFKYDKDKAKKYLERRKKLISARNKKEIEKNRKYRKNKEEYDRVKNFLSTRSLFAQFFVIYSYDNKGVYVKAKSRDSLVRKGKYGRMFIVDFLGLRGVTFTRTVYPCGSTINFDGYVGVPVYACSLDTATQMLLKRIRRNHSKPNLLEQAFEGRKTEEVEKQEQKKKEMKKKKEMEKKKQEEKKKEQTS